MSLFNSVDAYMKCLGFCQLPLSNTGAAVTSRPVSSVCCDWLQVYCMGIPISQRGIEVRLLPYSTQQYKFIAQLHSCGDLLGTVAWSPFSSALNPHGCILKLDNKILYRTNPFFLMKGILHLLDLSFKNISRIDVARDFNTFRNGMNPENLIKSFLNEKLLKVGATKFKVHGGTNESVSFDYLRFGGNTSDFAVYLYNKKKEMDEVKMKPWIIDKCKATGINTDVDFWRLEVSLKSSMVKMISKESSEILDLNLDYFSDVTNLEVFYYVAIGKYFRFKRNDSKSNKSRNRDVQLFDESNDQHILKSFDNSLPSNRSAKIFIKHLEMYNNEMRGIGIYQTMERQKVLDDYVRIHKLDKFYHEKIKGLTKCQGQYDT